jgi:hypothetical protein
MSSYDAASGAVKLQDGTTTALAQILQTSGPIGVGGGLGVQALAVTDYGGVSNPAIFDVTSGANAANDTGILDVTAWRLLFIRVSTSAAPTANALLQMVDDAGISILVASIAIDGAVFFNNLGWGPGCSVSTPGGISFAVPAPLPRRVRIQIPAQGGVVTSRLIVIGRR